jgi:hypothetical protein
MITIAEVPEFIRRAEKLDERARTPGSLGLLGLASGNR